MKKKSLSMFLALSMIATMVLGCGEADPGQESTETGAVPENNDGPVTLKMWGAEEDQALLQGMCEAFAAANSDTSFQFEIDVMSESDCKDNLLGDVKKAPDLFAFVDDQLQGFVAAGIISPVENPDEIAAANVEGAVSASTVNDTLYAYPMTADNGFFMYYDKSVFEPEDLATLDGMMAKAQAAGKSVYFEITNGWYMYSFYGNTGLTIGLNDDGISNHCDWNATDTPITGLDVLHAMTAIAQNPGFAKDLTLSLVDGAKNGIYCAGVSGVWDFEALKEIWGENLGATKLPTYTVNEQQVQLSSFAGYKMIGVNEYSDNKQWAHKLAQWLTNEENQIARFNARGLGPSNINASQSPEVSSSVALRALNEQAQFSTLQRIGGNYWDPAVDIAQFAVQNNPQGLDPQQFLDTQVGLITKSNAE